MNGKIEIPQLTEILEKIDLLLLNNKEFNSDLKYIKSKVSTEKYLKTKEVAELCQVTVQAVINWRRQGKIKAVTTGGGKPRYVLSEIEAFLRARNK